MSSPKPPLTDDRLFRDLLDGLSPADRTADVSLGMVGGSHPPRPPVHCLHACLNGDPTAIAQRGCPLLIGATRGVLDLGLLQDGHCRMGFRAAARSTALGGQPAVLLSVAGPLGPNPAHTGEPDVLGRLESAARLVQHVGLLLEENTGFANEVLQNYEQLNLVFDLTRQIAHVTDAQEIEKLLLQRLAHLLGSQRVAIIDGQGAVRTYEAGGGEPGPDPALLAETVRLVRRARQIQVLALNNRQAILGPLVRLDDDVDVVYADRDPGQPVFNAGDLMLVESILAFGGQIISNTELHERLRRMSLEVTHAMVAAIDKKDHYTSGHSERGGFLTRLTARELGLSLSEQQTMEWAGLLHDIGKIGIPEEILCKPGKLTPEEFEVIKQHPRMGYEILKPIASLGVILDGVLYHHEYPDGSGYPEGLRGAEIPLVARIIHVVDTFDALTSTRAYRKAFSVEKALEIIRNEMGQRIDPQAAEAFFRAFDAYRQHEPTDFASRFPNVVEREVAHAQP